MSSPSPLRPQRLLRTLEGDRPPRPMPVGGWIAAVGGAVVLFWLSVPNLIGFYEILPAVAFALSSLQCLTIPLAARFPRIAMLLHVAAIVLIGTVTRASMDDFWPVPVPNLVALTAILVLLGLREDWFVSVAAWWSSFLAMTIVVALNPDQLSSRSEWGVDVLVSVTATLIALAVAVSIGQRRRVREIVAAARRDVELEQARRATVEERARIARELHDVVAHSMSIVHIQAESARYRVASLAAARTEFDDIARSARGALAEMRQLLEALHPGDDPLYAPQPGLADLPDLVTSAEKVGSRVQLRRDDDLDRLGPLLQLTAYRIVQEALSNVIRHAPHADIDIALRRYADHLVVSIRNGPPPVDAIRRPSSESGGRGLRGMRERVALLHGYVEQTPTPGGGYLIAATLPVAGEDLT